MYSIPIVCQVRASALQTQETAEVDTLTWLCVSVPLVWWEPFVFIDPVLLNRVHVCWHLGSVPHGFTNPTSIFPPYLRWFRRMLLQIMMDVD